MESLVRNATLSFSRRYNYYQVLEKCNNNKRNSTMSRKLVAPSTLPGLGAGVGYRRERARKRQIFLQSYNLSFQSHAQEESMSVKLKKTLVKVKSRVVSIFRWNAFRSCCMHRPPALSFPFPRPLVRVTPLSTPSL